MKCEKAELAKVYKVLMHFGSNLLGLPSKKSVPAVLTSKPAHKNPKKLISPQNKRRKTVKQRHMQFEGVPVEKEGEKVTTRVSSRGRIIYRRRKS